MTYWIKRIARIVSIGSFFIGFFMSIDPTDPFNAAIIAVAFCKGCAGALFFWLAGFVVADIIIKGLVIGVPTDQEDTLEGGLLQRLFDAQSAQTPQAAAAHMAPAAGAGAKADGKKHKSA